MGRRIFGLKRSLTLKLTKKTRVKTLVYRIKYTK